MRSITWSRSLGNETLCCVACLLCVIVTSSSAARQSRKSHSQQYNGLVANDAAHPNDVLAPDDVTIPHGNEDDSNEIPAVVDHPQCGCHVMSGPPGSPGLPGVPGMHGMRGHDGQRGEKGERGQKGDPGPFGMRGPVGPSGERGKRGNDGERGLKGDQGTPGEKGDRGFSGFAGTKGQKGEPSVETARPVAPQPAKIAFSVARSHKLGPVVQDTPVTFDVVHANVGDGFDVYSSRFVCRVNGTYQFSVHVLGQNGRDVFAWIMMNDRHRAPLHGDGRAGYGSGSQTIILPLRRDDTVWIQLNKDSALMNDYSTFSGHLLFED